MSSRIRTENRRASLAQRLALAPYSVWAMCWSAGNERRFAYPFI